MGSKLIPASGIGNRSLAIQYVPVYELKPNAQNPRQHSKKQIRQISQSILIFGFLCPLLVDKFNNVIAGHGRLEAAKLLGMTAVPVIRVEGLSPAQIQAFAIAENKLNDNSTWDESKLAFELQQLLEIEGLDFDVTITGFEIGEIDSILEESHESAALEDTIPELVLDQPAVSEIGDLWRLGKHQIYCADSRKDETYRSLLGTHRAAAVFTDSPWNVKINGHATGNGATRHREFLMASGEMSDTEFVAFLHDILTLLVRYSSNGSVHYLCIDWRHIADMISVAKQLYGEFLNCVVWTKDNAGMGSFYRSQHELILVFRNGSKSHRNNIQLGRYGRNRSNVWRYPGANSFSKQSDEGNLLTLHPTVKPVAMVADAILDSTARGDIVLDAFLGSGTTLMAAQRVGRVCHGIEIDARYIDLAIRRWQRHTGDHAVHAVTGKRFDDVACERLEASRG
jgi:DNA modification methylase